MQKLIDGLHDFQANVFATRRQFFERLALGQRPEALFVKGHASPGVVHRAI